MSAWTGVLAITGPTASGKSALAMALAERLSGEILNADAFAVYRGLDAGTAKPSLEDRARVPHHLVDVKDPREPYSAGEFATAARAIAKDVLARGKLPILCGGTGFYVRTFFEGLFEGPLRNEALRSALGAVAARRGPAFLHRALTLLDPESAARVLPGDAARATRYLEIAFETGQQPSRLFRERPGVGWDGPAVKIFLECERAVLVSRIEERCRREILPRLPVEVEGLLARGVPPDAPGFSAIGYREAVAFLAGELTEAAFESAVIQSTRRFAKRQETWFRKEPGLVRLKFDDRFLIQSCVSWTESLRRQ
ncbi:MAG: tRNA (adenosine(37)-N6)-dimethylallyltransferase MiaA [Acidobacteria bacterium]|nr:tRNA (adenosine(37)-N6)-dimethylallyltransferase MiaA [Acidobacteriota bacterium]